MNLAMDSMTHMYVDNLGHPSLNDGLLAARHQVIT